MAPGPDGSAGSSGWGWDNATNSPVTDLTAGTTNGFTVNVLQPNTEQANGTITLSWDPYDFTYVSNEDTSATCTGASQNPDPYMSPGVETCSYTDMAHSSKGDTFQFTAGNNADPDAVIGVSVDVNGEQATGQFPVQISSASAGRQHR
jgi:hypothetical protein